MPFRLYIRIVARRHVALAYHYTTLHWSTTAAVVLPACSLMRCEEEDTAGFCTCLAHEISVVCRTPELPDVAALPGSVNQPSFLVHGRFFSRTHYR